MTHLYVGRISYGEQRGPGLPALERPLQNSGRTETVTLWRVGRGGRDSTCWLKVDVRRLKQRNKNSLTIVCNLSYFLRIPEN